MPRPGPRRPLVAFKLGDEVIARLDACAAAEKVNRSEAIRLAVEFMLAEMPAGWRPPSEES